MRWENILKYIYYTAMGLFMLTTGVCNIQGTDSFVEAWKKEIRELTWKQPYSELESKLHAEFCKALYGKDFCVLGTDAFKKWKPVGRCE